MLDIKEMKTQSPLSFKSSESILRELGKQMINTQ